MSPTLKKRLAGKIAKLAGEYFETSLEYVCSRDQIILVRIPDGCKVRKHGRSLKLVRVKTPFDFIIAKKNKAIFFDAKSINSKTFPYSCIDSNQLYHLSKLNSEGLKAGYLIRFREIDQIVFFDVQTLAQLKPRESLNVNMGTSLGSFHEFSLNTLFS